MTHSRRTLLLVLTLAPWASPPAAQADDEADHAALRSLVSKYEAAVQKGDPSVLKPYLAPEFTGVMITGDAVNDFESLDAYWQSIEGLLGDGGKYAVKVNVPAPATIVGDVAYAHGTTEDTAITADGEKYDFEGFWTAVCQRQDDDSWKVVRIHGSMDPIGNTFVLAAVQAALIPAGIVGGCIGAVLGGGLAWFLTRQRRAAGATA